MKKLILIIKGFIIGTANIIPGVSGGTLMMSLGVFEDIIESVSHFFSNKKKNFMFLLYIFLGVTLSLIIMSRVVTFSLENFKLSTIMFFLALIIGGIPMLLKNVKSEKLKLKYIFAFLIPFVLVISMSLISDNGFTLSFSNMNFISYVSLFLVGVLAAASMIIPGLSGSFILILFGYYEPIMNSIKEFTSFYNLSSNLIILSIFGIGVLFGLFTIIKLIEYLLNKYKTITYCAILGFVTSSVIAIIITNFASGMIYTPMHIASSVILFVLGIIISLKLGE